MRASLDMAQDSRLVDYAGFRARLREDRKTKNVGFSPRQRALEHPPWRPSSPNPQPTRRPRSAPASRAPPVDIRVKKETAERLADVITEAGLVTDDSAAMDALSAMLAQDQRHLNGNGLAHGAKTHVEAVREQQRVYMEAVEAGAAEEEEAAEAEEAAAADQEDEAAEAVEERQEGRGADVQAEPLEAVLHQSISLADLRELKAYAKPPRSVKVVMEAVCLLLGLEPTWAQAKALFDSLIAASRSGAAGPLGSLEVESVRPATIRKLKRSYIGKDALDVQSIGKVSKAAQSLCLWVNNVFAVATGQPQTQPPPAAERKAGKRRTKKRPSSGGSRGSSPVTGANRANARGPGAKKSAKKAGKRPGPKRTSNAHENGATPGAGTHAAAPGSAMYADLIGQVSMGVQQGLSGDELLRLCESLGENTVGATQGQVRVHDPHACWSALSSAATDSAGSASRWLRSPWNWTGTWPNPPMPEGCLPALIVVYVRNKCSSQGIR